MTSVFSPLTKRKDPGNEVGVTQGWNFIAAVAVVREENAVDHCGSLWITVDHCGSLWITVDHCGSLWTRTAVYCRDVHF